MSNPVRDGLGRLLDVCEGATPEEIADAIDRRNAEDGRNLADLSRLGIVNGRGPGWGDR